MLGTVRPGSIRRAIIHATDLPCAIYTVSIPRKLQSILQGGMRFEVSMRQYITLGAAAGVLLSSLVISAEGQGAPPQAPPGGQPPAGQGQRGGAGGGGRAGQSFPAQQRKLADPAVIERGST